VATVKRILFDATCEALRLVVAVPPDARVMVSLETADGDASLTLDLSALPGAGELERLRGLGRELRELGGFLLAVADLKPEGG
jgi:hypothetical protein